MAKYSERLVCRIERLIETDNYTISDICRVLRISRETFYQWKETKADFRHRIIEAEDRRDEELVKIARVSLKKKIQGYTTLEEHCYYEPARSNSSVMILKKKVVKTKDKDPDLRAIQYVLDKEEKRKEKEREQNKETKPTIIQVRNDWEAQCFLRQHRINIVNSCS